MRNQYVKLLGVVVGVLGAVSISAVGMRQAAAEGGREAIGKRVGIQTSTAATLLRTVENDGGIRTVQCWPAAADTPANHTFTESEEIAVSKVYIAAGNFAAADGAKGGFTLETTGGSDHYFVVDGFKTWEYTFQPPLKVRAGASLNWTASGSGNGFVQITLYGTPLSSNKITLK